MKHPLLAVLAPGRSHGHDGTALKDGPAGSIDQVAGEEAVIPVLAEIALEMHRHHVADFGGPFHLHSDLWPDQFPCICANEILGAVATGLAILIAHCDEKVVSAVVESLDAVSEEHSAGILGRRCVAQNRLHADLGQVEGAERSVAPTSVQLQPFHSER